MSLEAEQAFCATGVLCIVFLFPDVFSYSREYGNGSSHSWDSRVPRNDVYYEGLIERKNLLIMCCTQVLLLIFIS